MKKNPIDSLVLEWAYRCKKGYPDINNLEDKKVLEKIMKEWKLTEQEEEKSFNEKIQSLSKDLQEKVREVYNTLSDSTKLEINKHIGAYTVQGFETNLTKLSIIFAPFFSIKADGVGRGEMLPLITIKGSKTGGTADKDIIVGNSVIEVKELDEGGKFRTGKTGSIRDTKLDANMQTLIKILRDLKNIPELEKNIGEILEYYTSTYKTGSGRPSFFTKDIKNLLDKLKRIENNSQEFVKIDGKRYSFTRKDGNTIILGVELDDLQVALSKIKQHPYYKDINELVTNFIQVKENYLESIDYLLLYKKDLPESAILLNKEKAKNEIEVYDVNQQAIRLMYGRPPVITL